MTYPNDENGDVLRRMETEGDDLSRPRDIDFNVIFSTESSAKEFADHFRSEGVSVSCESVGTVEGLPWDVIVTKNMVPTHESITDFEGELESIAVPLGGRNDGWGCFSEPGRSIQ